MVHVVNKGKDGEREVCTLLRSVIDKVIALKQYDAETVDALRSLVQRNQNQSAVGGGDINVLGISFEVKRQETLAIDQWWKQANVSAARNGDIPVLIFRQNGKRVWRVVMFGHIGYCNGSQSICRVEIDQITFESWFFTWVVHKVERGEITRV